MDLTLRTETSLAGVKSADWNALDHAPSPFLEHGFLRALELSGSIGEDAGWDPHYLMVFRPGSDGGPEVLVGAIPAFVKTHSYGEYIFDWAWARASERAGLRYYPKIVVAAPVTPATGRRILLHPDLAPDPRDAVAGLLLEGLMELAEERGVSGVHFLFCTSDEQELLTRHRFMPRLTYQFHWHNQDYGSFDDFLGELASRKRKQFKKERRKAHEFVEPVEFVRGDELSDDDLAAMDRYYRRTVANHGGFDYLQPGFFHHLVELAPERIRFGRARSEGETVAGALFLQTEQGLYGRYWGCDREHDCLHFETAYYAGIEHCIREGIPLFEAGAQGEHKLLRGFMPAPTYSAHWIRHPGLRQGVHEFVTHEARAVGRHMEELAGYAPYKKEG